MPAAEAMAAALEVRRVPAGSGLFTIRGGDPTHPDNGLWLLWNGEVLLARSRASGSAESIWTAMEGGVFAEETLDGLLSEAGRVVRTAAPTPTWEDVQRRVGIAPVPGAESVPGMLRAHASAPSVVAFASVARLRELLAGPLGAEVLELLYGLHQVSLHADVVVASFDSHDVLRHITTSQRYALLEGARWFEGEGALVVETGDLVVAVAGDVEVWFPGDAFPSQTLTRGGIVGYVSGPERLRPAGYAAGVLVPRLRFAELMERSGAFRRRVMHAAPPHTPLGEAARRLDRSLAEVVSFTVAPATDPGVEPEALANLLGQAIVRQFGDRVAVLCFMPSGATEVVERFGVWHVTCPVASFDEVERVQRSLASQGFDYLVQVHDRLPDDLRTACEGTVDRWLSLCRDAGERSEVERATGADLVPVVCLHLDPPEVAPECPVALAMPVRNARLFLDPAEVARTGFADLASAPRSRPSVERLGRLVTDRLVGVALGGGGALGLVHIALLEGMWREGLPVDVVSGTSFGAVAGAYFCSGPDRPYHPQTNPEHKGLRMLWDRIPSMSWLVVGAMLDGQVLQDFVNEDLGSPQLERLPVPFVPVSTEAATLAPTFPSGRTAGFGVWCSGALPPVFGAPVDQSTQVRFLDGGFVANVPGDVLVSAGAAFVVVSNAIAAPYAAAGLRDRVDLMTRALSVQGLDLRQRLLAVRAAMQGQLLPLPSLAAGSAHGGWRHRLAGGVSRALGQAVPERVEDTVRGMQQAVADLGMGAARSREVVFAPQLNLLAAAAFWRGADIVDIAREHRDVSGVMEDIRAGWRRLRRSTSPAAASVGPPDPWRVGGGEELPLLKFGGELPQ